MLNIIKTFRAAYCGDHKPSRMVCVWCLLISVLLYLAAATNTASAATYYLDAVGGDDSNPGTSNTPWKTLNKAQSVLVEGDIVLLRSGNYGPFGDGTSTRADWITYKADDGHTPVFTYISLGLWTGPYDKYLHFEDITIGPGNPSGDHRAVFSHLCNYVRLRNCIIDGNSSPENEFQDWGTQNAGVVLFGSTNIEIDNCTISNFKFGVWTKKTDVETEHVTVTDCNITHVQHAITFWGNDWTIHNNTLHDLYSDGIILQGRSSTISNNSIYNIDRPVVYTDDTGASYDDASKTITADSGTPFADWSSSYCQFVILTVDGTRVSGAFYEVNSFNSNSITLKYALGQDYPTITKIETTSNYHLDGIQTYPQTGSYDPNNVTVRNNIIHDIGAYTWSDAQGVWSGSSKDGSVSYNHMTYENNLIYDIYGSGRGVAFFGTHRNLIVRNNTLPDDRLEFIWDAQCDDFSGNLVQKVDFQQRYEGEDYDPKTPNPTYCDYNVVQNWWVHIDDVNFVYGDNSVELNDDFFWQSQFEDYDNGDYTLASGSSAVDIGAPNAPATDILGNPRDALPDAGCYESSPSDPNNPTPELQAIGDKSVDENVALTFTVNATDPNGEPITYLAQGLPSGATLDSLTGEFAWTPSYTQAGSYQVTFRASDGNSQDSQIITITVNNVNRPPVLGAITDQSVNENVLLSIPVEASDPDGQALTYSVSGLPAGAVFVSQTLTWTPSYDQAGTFGVTFTADDGQAQDSEAITITVINVNRTPVLTAINNQSVWADDPLTFTIDATDPDGDAVTYSAGTMPSGATFATQTFDWTPSQGQMGSYDVTFLASDGQLQDSEIVTITVDVDSLAPTVTNLSPTAGTIQVPLNNLITLDVTDAGKGIEPKSVKIKVKTNSNPNNNTVYFGDMDHYISLLGDCRRIGSNTDYKFVFQPTQDLFYYDQTVTITVNATDLAGNVMNEYSYSFATEMHSFGQNKQVNSGLGNNDRPVTVCDSSGNIWTAWHTGSIGNRDIYIGKLTAGEENFGSTIQLTDNTNDQYNPAVALDSNDKLYVVWQDNREGDWDIYLSTSVDGTSWSTEIRVNDPNDGNQVNPAIVIDGQSPNQAHVVWQDDRAGNQDICIAASSDGFATKTVWQITTDSFDQVEPAVTADADNTIYVVWTDGRNGSNDIYGAASNNPWTNVAIVSNANNQSSPTIAAESVGSILHLLWVDDTLGDKDIYYASSDGLPGSPLTGSSIIDDSSGADQLDPAIAVTGSTGNNLKVFACWQDWRNTDTDLYFAELSSSSGTNVFVGDGGSSTYQGEPVIGIDEYSHPYLIWADNRSTSTEIYYAGSTFVEPVALASELVTASASSSTTVGADPQAITTIDDVSVVVPAGACSYDVAITVTKIANPQAFAAPCLGGYDFGPSGIQFSQPVTITIPYSVSESNGSTLPYWYNSLTGTLSQQGITDVQDIVISPTLHALSFKTTHFTAFYLLGGGAAAVLGGGGGGGCSVSAGGEGTMVEFVLPYIGLVVVMAILKVRDARERKARST